MFGWVPHGSQGRAGPALGYKCLWIFHSGHSGYFWARFSVPAVSQIWSNAWALQTFFPLILFGIILTAYPGNGISAKGPHLYDLGFVGGNHWHGQCDQYTKIYFSTASPYPTGWDWSPLRWASLESGRFSSTWSNPFNGISTIGSLKNLLPTVQDWLSSIGAIIRGSLVGFFLGILPGGGALLASFFSYGLEKKISKHPEKFGTGVIEGVAAPNRPIMQGLKVHSSHF